MRGEGKIVEITICYLQVGGKKIYPPAGTPK